MASHGQHHITPLKTFLKIYGTLILLTILTVFTATKVDLGDFNTPLAMIIATAKVLLVMFFFMHLKYDTKLNKITIASAFFFLIVFVGFTAMDIFTRKNLQNVSIEDLEAAKKEMSVSPVPTEEPAPTDGH